MVGFGVSENAIHASVRRVARFVKVSNRKANQRVLIVRRSLQGISDLLGECLHVSRIMNSSRLTGAWIGHKQGLDENSWCLVMSDEAGPVPLNGFF